MKKMIAMVLIVCSLVFIVSGCGNDATSDTSTPTAPTVLTDTSVKLEVEPELKPEFLAEAQGWGYYVDEDGKNICRMKTDDPKDSSVILNYESLLEFYGHTVFSLYVIDELLFFRVGFTLYRYDMETEKLTKIYPDARTIGISGKDIYFSGREATIYKINAYDEQATAILESGKEGNDKQDWKNLYKSFIFIDDVMYYYKRNPDGLYRYENSESTLIDDNETVNEFSLSERNGKLYYTASANGITESYEYDPISKTVKSLGQSEGNSPVA